MSAHQLPGQGQPRLRAGPLDDDIEAAVTVPIAKAGQGAPAGSLRGDRPRRRRAARAAFRASSRTSMATIRLGPRSFSNCSMPSPM